MSENHIRDFVKQFTSIKPVVMEDFPEAQNVFLQVTNQQFCVTRYGCETLQEAEWTQAMLCSALAKVIQDWQEREVEGTSS